MVWLNSSETSAWEAKELRKLSFVGVLGSEARLFVVSGSTSSGKEAENQRRFLRPGMAERARANWLKASMVHLARAWSSRLCCWASHWRRLAATSADRGSSESSNTSAALSWMPL